MEFATRDECAILVKGYPTLMIRIRISQTVDWVGGGTGYIVVMVRVLLEQGVGVDAFPNYLLW